ncbi:MAG TPA: Fpg/Nei family DNA glycosylase [Actinomycetaceae bacterium]|nr:Fpg/Nei family DNA glycosylase [Actinomycetaceae bacterium]
MPEGHVLHRLALAFGELFGGHVVEVSSPQGRFAAGAELIDGWRLVATDAHGKHLFLGFAPPDAGVASEAARGEATGAGEYIALAQQGPGAEPAGLRWLRVHLGLYGSWTFDGDPEFHAPHSIGAPRRRVGEEERGLPSREAPSADGDGWQVPEPRGQVRARLVVGHGVADLTGPSACEIVDVAAKHAVHARLGPDPLRADGDVEDFVSRVRRRRRPIGDLLMDQSIIAGVGNIYRAEALYRARVHPWRLGVNVPPARLREIWHDLVALMTDGMDTGEIVTTDPHDRREENDHWYVYHRSGKPCLRCDSTIVEDLMANRRVFWCPREQRRPPRRAQA